MFGRRIWVIAHRWAGLTLAFFLTVAGLTGVLLPWYDELDSALAPELYSAPPHQSAAVLDPAILRQKVIAAYPGAVIDFMPLSVEPGRSVSLSLDRIDPKTGASSDWSADWDQLFVDPYTGRTLGGRKWGDLLQGDECHAFPLPAALLVGAWGYRQACLRRCRADLDLSLIHI